MEPNGSHLWSMGSNWNKKQQIGSFGAQYGHLNGPWFGSIGYIRVARILNYIVMQLSPRNSSSSTQNSTLFQKKKTRQKNRFRPVAASSRKQCVMSSSENHFFLTQLAAVYSPRLVTSQWCHCCCQWCFEDEKETKRMEHQNIG